MTMHVRGRTSQVLTRGLACRDRATGLHAGAEIQADQREDAGRPHHLGAGMGQSAGPEIVLIHGFAQSHLSWIRQVNSDLAREFRIITYDLRGHGNSDKPLEKAPYHDNKAWGDEVKAVIDAAGLKRPVLVGWSYAGRVISDYVTTHGADKIAGINFVGASIKAFPEFAGDNLKNLPGMMSEDLATNIAATRAFVRGCFEKQPTAEDFEIMLSFNMMVPPKVRAQSGRPAARRDRGDVEAQDPGAGDARRTGPQRQARHRAVHREDDPRRETLGL